MKSLISSLVLLILYLPSYGQSWQWAESFSSDGSVEIIDIAVDGTNNVYIVGVVYDATGFTIGTDAYIIKGDQDAFIGSFSSNGNYRWSKQLAGIAYDEVKALDVDQYDSIYVVGNFQDAAIYFTASDSLENFNHVDSYIAKYAPNGTLSYVKRPFWGNGQQRIQNIEVNDVKQEIAVTGVFTDQMIYHDGSTEIILPLTGTKDLFVATFSFDSIFKDIVVFSATALRSVFKNINICHAGGYFLSGDIKGRINFTGTKFIEVETTKSDVLVVRVNDNLDYLWSRAGRGVTFDHTNSAISDKYSNIYLTGKTQSDPIIFDSTATENSVPLTGLGGIDMFLTKYNRNGNLQWAIRNGYTGNDDAFGLDIFQNLVQFAGIYTDQFIVNQDTLLCEVVGDLNTSFAIYDIDGNPVGAQQVGGDLEEQGTGVAFDSNGHTYITGYSASPTIKFGTLTLNNTSTPSYDGFLAKYVYPFSPRFTKIQHVSCNGGSDGELIVTPQFGAGPYTYAWSHDPGLTDSIATNLTAGDYTCTVTATGSAEVVPLSMTITEPLEISIAESITDVLCHPENGAGNDGVIDITVTGGTPGFTYSWTTLDGSGVEALDEDQFSLTAGTYYVEVTDDNGCVEKDTFLVSQPQQIFFNGTKTDITVPPGSNGAIDLETTGGTAPYAWSWIGPKSFTASTEDLSGLVNAGTYVVNLTDDNSCTADTAITVPVDTMLIAYVCNLGDVECYGESNGFATVCMENGSGDYTFYWTNSVGGHVGGNNATLSNMPAGTYYCEVTDNVSLKTAEINPPAIIEEPDAELTLIFDPHDLECNGDNSGSIDLTISGGTLPYTFIWTGPNGFTSSSEDIDNLEAGHYTCVVVDANGCTTSLLNYEIEEPLLLGVNPIVTDVLCYGELTGSADANASGGTGSRSYLWDDPAAQTDQTAEFLEAGTYHVTVTDANGCQEIGTAIVGQPDAPIAITESHQDASCYGGSDGTISLTISGGTPPYEYNWDDGPVSKNRENLSAGTYCVTVTDKNNCTEYLCIDIGEAPEIIIASVDEVDVTLCPGNANGEITVTASGGTGALEYSVDGGTTWQASGSFSGLTAGDYPVSVKDENGCEVAGPTVTLEDPPGAEFPQVSFSNPVCPEGNDGSITITATGGVRPYQYSVDDGNTWQADSAFTTLTAGSYDLWLKDANDCETAGPAITLVDPPGVEYETISFTNLVCPNVDDGTITIIASGGTTPYQYSIDDGMTWQSENLFTDLSAGPCYVWVKDGNGCTYEYNGNPINLTSGPGIVISSIYGTTNCSIEIDAYSNATPIEYSFDGGVTFITSYAMSTDSLCGILNQGDSLAEVHYFDVVVRDDDGCMDTETIEVRGCKVICEPDEIWEAITPNGDGFNDEWELIGYQNKYPDMVVRIYSTWGNLVFESPRGYPDPWDGTKDGKALPAGTYFYVIDKGDGSDPVSGTVNIVK